jgi:hypothetical protein
MGLVLNADDIWYTLFGRERPAAQAEGQPVCCDGLGLLVYRRGSEEAPTRQAHSSR